MANAYMSGIRERIISFEEGTIFVRKLLRELSKK